MRDGVDGVEVVVGQTPRQHVQVTTDPTRARRLGQDAARRPALQRPLDEALSDVAAGSSRYADDCGIFHQLGRVPVEHRRGIGRTKRRIRGEVDPVAGAEPLEFVLGPVRVALHLAHAHRDGGVSEQVADFLLAEVADADGFDESPSHEVLHRLPRVQDGRRDDGAAFVARHRPVHQVQVEVLEFEQLEGLFQRSLDFVGFVVGVPELAGDEDLLAVQLGALEDLLESLADLALVLVDAGAVDVEVAGLEGGHDGVLDLAGLGLPSSESNQRDRFVSPVRFESRGGVVGDTGDVGEEGVELGLALLARVLDPADAVDVLLILHALLGEADGVAAGQVEHLQLETLRVHNLLDLEGFDARLGLLAVVDELVVEREASNLLVVILPHPLPVARPPHLRLVRLGRRERGEDPLGLEVLGVVLVARFASLRREVLAEVLALLLGEVLEELVEVEGPDLHRFVKTEHRALLFTLRSHATARRSVSARARGKRSRRKDATSVFVKS